MQRLSAPSVDKWLCVCEKPASITAGIGTAKCANSSLYYTSSFLSGTVYTITCHLELDLEICTNINGLVPKVSN